MPRKVYAVAALIGTCLLIAVGSFLWAIANNSEGARKGSDVYEVLCAQRTNLAASVARTTYFLQNPGRFPAFADPQTVKLIQQGLSEDRALLATSARLDC